MGVERKRLYDIDRRLIEGVDGSSREELESKARQLRCKLGLIETESLDWEKLVGHLQIPTVPVDALLQYGALQEDVNCLTVGDSGFYGLTIWDGDDCVIVYNPNTEPTIQAFSIVHEAAHVILNHRTGLLVDTRTNQILNDEQVEGEAEYLAGALLVPPAGVVKIFQKCLGKGVKKARDLTAKHFGVTRKVIETRMSFVTSHNH